MGTTSGSHGVTLQRVKRTGRGQKPSVTECKSLLDHQNSPKENRDYGTDSKVVVAECEVLPVERSTP